MTKNLIFTKFKKYVIVLNVYVRARGSVDRATGSGPVGRGFKSLRAHFMLNLKTLLSFNFGFTQLFMVYNVLFHSNP